MIVWDAFTTNKVNHSVITNMLSLIKLRVYFKQMVLSPLLVGTCCDYAMYLGDGLCIRSVWVCSSLWVSVWEDLVCVCVFAPVCVCL